MAVVNCPLCSVLERGEKAYYWAAGGNATCAFMGGVRGLGSLQL